METAFRAEEAHQLRLGDSIQLGVPVIGTKVEFDYILVQRPLKDIELCLAKVHREGAKAIPCFQKTQEEVDRGRSRAGYLKAQTLLPLLFCGQVVCEAVPSVASETPAETQPESEPAGGNGTKQRSPRSRPAIEQLQQCV
ncbi:hypothetical protein GBF38_006233 [Nibea albiflora]|uniref:Uncharacterized protein n=1 Tax=Nibea albiflora TaxID=240163 RepID=A0ACB7FAZ3_NIBAL|nr:hypothetical protein GBF38_006233 [Nibea albiflora]